MLVRRRRPDIDPLPVRRHYLPQTWLNRKYPSTG
jgi:hypothetical protein